MIRFLGMLAAAVGVAWFLVVSGITPAAAHVGTPPAKSYTPFPMEFDIPRIDARSKLIPLTLNTEGELQPPPLDQPMQAGWYVDGVRPGAIGPAVIAAHVSGRGPLGTSVPGVFAKLSTLHKGDLIHILRSDNTEVHFTVTHVETYEKDKFPTEEVYGDTIGPELRLITCGGTHDTVHHRYEDNVVVYAVQIS